MGRAIIKFGLLAIFLLLCVACGSSKGNQKTLQNGQPLQRPPRKSGINVEIITTGTPNIPASTPTIAGLLPPLVDENCLPVSEAGAQVGQTVCLKGTITKALQTDYGFQINFDDRPNGFLLIIPDSIISNQTAGQCILVKGKVVSKGGQPQITLSNTDQLQNCR